MATGTVLCPPSNTIVPGSRLLPTAPFPDTQGITSSIPNSIAPPEPTAHEWVSSFKHLLSEVAAPSKRLFLKESYWRDLLCMTWDFHTLQGYDQITRFIEGSSKDCRISNLSLDKSAAHKMPQVATFGDLKVIQAFLKIETSSGRGEGLVRLLPDMNDGGRWKAFTLFTTLQELKGYEETIYNRRPTGLGSSLENGSQNWKDRLIAQQNFEGGREPNVFTPKDKLADWFEYYAGVFELNVWTSTTLETSEWSERMRQWTITLVQEKDGRKANTTGHSGEPYMPSNIAGLDAFKGDRLVHSSQFTRPRKNAKGKKAVVVGCCNSGHDIARDYYDHGYDVTMLQRSSTLVVTSESLIDVIMKDLYSEDGPPVEEADLINMSIPNPVAKRLHTAASNEMTRRDDTLLHGLTAAGFAIDSGPDGSGLFMKYLSRGGGYYIDVGASQLVADKRIKIKQGQEIKRIKAHSVVLTDDSELEADEIVFATGYQNMRETARKLFGPTCSELSPYIPYAIDKTAFSMMVPELRSALIQASPQPYQIAIVGIETHICVTQTALDLLTEGHRVYIIADGVSSCNQAERGIALERLGAEGAIVTTSESWLYECMGDASIPEYDNVKATVEGDVC
ncbi:MAG: hypothetical protein Q9217_000880 [Psora testacea]